MVSHKRFRPPGFICLQIIRWKDERAKTEVLHGVSVVNLVFNKSFDFSVSLI